MSYHRHPHTYTGEITLNISSLEQSMTFYQDVLGFQILERTQNRAVLTADGKSPLITIEQPENVLPKQRSTTGLYHYALLLPSRSDLANILRHLIQVRYPLQGASDHLVSEALYLADPDGNGIEIYTDRSPDTWRWVDGEVVMSTDPLDVEGLLAEGNGEEWIGLPEGTVMGHIHLHVSELQKVKEFYTNGLGFDIANSQYGDQVLFVSTGGYHHHIGLNTWSGVGAQTPPDKSVGLKWYSLVFPSKETRSSTKENLRKIGAWVHEENGVVLTKDPSGNQIKLTVLDE